MNRPIVTVKQGKLQGIRRENVLGSHYFSFRGIPFAAPPVGKLRFQDPTPPASWDRIRDASQEGNVCLQFDRMTQTIIGSEDCLYLNVHIPCTIYGSTRNPVMFYIHGGSFHFGSGTDSGQRYDYLLVKDVIIVSINYRLGVLGFLNLGHAVASGNQGLKDVIIALKWVRKNIEAFGGDPKNVTVFGNSVGSMIVHLLMISPLSKGLFHKAILQSGVSTCPIAIKEIGKEIKSFELASILGTDSRDPETVVEFLQTIPGDEIIEAQSKLYSQREVNNMNLIFSPTLDKGLKNPLFPRPIRHLLNDDNDIPIIIGYTTHEYIIFLENWTEDDLKLIYEDLPENIKKMGNIQDFEKVVQLTERTKQWYFNGMPCTGNCILPIIQCMSDIYMKIPTLEVINSRRKRKNALTYCYTFSYLGNETTPAQMVGNKFTIMGACHADELSYLLYLPQCKFNDPNPPPIGTRDRKVLEAFTSMWTNFAKTGNPTAVIDENVTTTWLPATADTFNCLEINGDLRCSTITDDTNIFQETS